MHEKRLEVRKKMEKEKEIMMKRFHKATKGLNIDSIEESETRTKTAKKKKKIKKESQISSRVSTGYSPFPINFSSPGNQATREKMKNEAKKVLESIKKKSKKALIKLLRDEEKRENERQDILETVVNQVERKRLEKIFEIERAKVREEQTILENKFQEDIDRVNGLYHGYD